MAGGEVLAGEARGHVLGLRFQRVKHSKADWITTSLPRGSM